MHQEAQLGTIDPGDRADNQLVAAGRYRALDLPDFFASSRCVLRQATVHLVAKERQRHRHFNHLVHFGESICLVNNLYY